MPDRQFTSRREILKLLGAAGSGGLSGCGRLPGSSIETTNQGSTPAETQTRPETGSVIGTETDPQTPQDDEQPIIRRITVVPTGQNGEVRYSLTATDNRGITSLSVSTPSASINREINQRNELKLTGTIPAPPGKISTVTFVIKDQAENQFKEKQRSYARKHQILDDPAYDIGAVYRWDIGGSIWQDCINGEPAIGGYDVPLDAVTSNRHLDQIQGFGIGRQIISVKNVSDIEKIETVWKAVLASDSVVEFTIDPLAGLDPEQTLESHLSDFGKKAGQLNRYATENERPVFTIKNLMEWHDGLELRSEIASEFDSVAEFMESLRNGLAIPGGRNPYLVGELVRWGTSRYEQQMRSNYSAELIDLVSRFDGIANQMWRVYDNEASWERAFLENTDRYLGGRLFAEDHDIDFIPVVYPGWDLANNKCDDSEGLIPRSPANFFELLDIAQAYTSSGRIRVRSFNNWESGTQIESGQMAGRRYGTAYLNSVKRIQKSDNRLDINDRSTIYVGPEGSDGNVGSKEEPLATIQHALYRAQPGDIVHVLPGRYQELIRTVRSGLPGNPITIEGPPEAVLTSIPDRQGLLQIRTSHIHLRGLTIDGLLNPDKPNDVESYNEGELVLVKPETDTDDYIQNVVVSPHQIGNSQRPLVDIERTKDSEVGPFRVIGPAGTHYTRTTELGGNGEIVYIGTNPGGLGSNSHPWTELDESRDIRVHHIDNSEGYAHSELVNTKPGTERILVEYCSDLGGGFVREEPNDSHKRGTINLGGVNGTVRWNDIQNHDLGGIEVNIGRTKEPWNEPIGQNTQVYGNRILNNKYRAFIVNFWRTQGDYSGQTSVDVLCGNEYNGKTDSNPDEQCPGNIPQCEGVGHLGGDSPWA